MYDGISTGIYSRYNTVPQQKSGPKSGRNENANPSSAQTWNNNRELRNIADTDTLADEEVLGSCNYNKLDEKKKNP